MSAFVKIVALVGFASMASATHDCESTNTGVAGDCSSGTTCGANFDLSQVFDLAPDMCGHIAGADHVCCSTIHICEPCLEGCDPTFVPDGCVTREDYIAGANDLGAVIITPGL